MRKLLNNKGHSLVELIVSFAVISILLSALFMICSATYGTIETNRHDTYADIVIDNISDYIKNTTGKTSDDLLIYDLSAPVDMQFESAGSAECYALAFYGGRLYDFGNVTDKWLLSDLIVGGIIDDNYRAFNEDYYNNTKVLVGVERNNDSTRWAAITLCAHRNGNRITRNRTMNFSMLNENAKILIGDNPAIAQAGLPEDGDIVDGSGDIAETDILFVYYKLPTV